MSLDNIQLSAFVIKDLFTNSLINLKNNNKTPISVSKAELAFLGKNEKSITILVKEPNSLYLNDEDLNFLIGVLNACKLTMADVSLVNFLNNSDLDYQKIKEKLNSNIIIMFDINPSEISLPLNFPTYQVQKYDNSTYLFSPQIEIIKNQKEEKIKLWNCLKQMFF